MAKEMHRSVFLGGIIVMVLQFLAEHSNDVNWICMARLYFAKFSNGLDQHSYAI